MVLSPFLYQKNEPFGNTYFNFPGQPEFFNQIIGGDHGFNHDISPPVGKE
jgi:hypothetical protein